MTAGRAQCNGIVHAFGAIRGFLIAASAVVLCIVVGACSPSATPPREHFIEEFVGGALPDALTFQSDILADGEVTFVEYERSVLATLACAESAGLEITGPILEADGYTYTYGYRGIDGDGNLLSDSVVFARFDPCYARYGELVDSVWFAQNVSSFRDAPQELKDAYVACFEEYGVVIARDAHITEFYRMFQEVPAVEQCSDRVER